MSALPAFAAQPASSARGAKRVSSRPSRPQVTAVRGAAVLTGPQPEFNLARVIVVLAFLLIAVTAVCCVRVWLSSAAVVSSMETTVLEQAVQDARSQGAAYEVSESSLSNPSRIAEQARELNMRAPAEVGVIEIDKDVVAIDETGALSLSQSVSNAVDLGV